VAVLAGVPLAAAGGLALAAYLAWVAVRTLRGAPASTPSDLVEPHRLRHPWRSWVEEAQRAQQRFDQAVEGAPAGPVSERLAAIGARVEDAVRECWRSARRGQELEDALAQLERPERLRQSLARAEAQGQGDVAAALRAQLDTAERLERVAADAGDRLQLMDARLDEAVARAVELSLRAGDPVELGGLGSDVDSLVTELEALRRGLEEVQGRPGTDAAS